MRKLTIASTAVLMTTILAACGTGASDSPDTLSMGFVPSQDADELADTVQPLADRLSEELGMEVQAEVVTNYVGLVEAMGNDQVDIGFLPPLGFVQAEQLHDVEVLLKSERFGDYEYLAQFNVRADNDEIDSIEDLVNSEGLVWAYGDTSSAAGFLFPANELMDAGVEDLNTQFQHSQVGAHDTALMAVLDGDADFSTSFDDARDNLEDDYPDIKDDIKVIDYTQPIPNDTISARPGLDEDLKNQVIEAFLSFNDDDEMLEVLDSIYNWTGIAEADSADYEVVRDTYERFQEDVSLD
ncbi:phosphate/phosphite/phosphonate ABC transporter substrate-binding protein [Geomicrobium sp. JCM 19038]|uniref:phosphate/phosphite/phosphonate ABC transporter substrate-binding protein n=1 Tax=Geomicrobium sp. JCM 19038 TaxID=1460635 RepID=UPI00045F1706|nr:phosphate/phosphite/phosphonate ABC transporter substrate-binding protein [Geomicrobium sp. JCM 19038]GAK07774.1 phosphonate ABC transporter phosphate-binding periplasmic component [Geomicrobium sp. JCM 19038]